MKNGKIVLLTTVMLSIMLMANTCTGGTGQGEVFQGGTQGLLLRFVDGAPPTLVYDSGASDFDLLLQVENAGEFDVDRIHFTISGINERDFQGSYLNGQGLSGWVTKDNSPDLGALGLAGKTRLESSTLPGDTTFVSLAQGVAYTRTLLGGGELNYNIMVDACYPYATLATSTVCYQRNYLDGNDNICSPKTSGEVSVSGGPLQITEFTQTAVGSNSLRLQYTFELKSNAKIWAPKAGDAQTCDPIGRSARTDRIREEGVFYVELDHLGVANSVRCIGLQQNSNFDAQHIKDIEQTALSGGLTGNAIRVIEVNPAPGASGYLKLVDGKTTLTCTLALTGSSTNNLGTVNVMAGYYVQDSARTAFAVTHSGQGGSGTPPSTSGTPPSGSGLSCSQLESSMNTICQPLPQGLGINSAECDEAQRAWLASCS